MSMIHFRPLVTRVLVVSLCAMMIPQSLVYAAKEFREVRNADPQGSVEIVDIAGQIDLSGWDRSEIEVIGTSDEALSRVHMTTDGNQTVIYVRPLGDGGSGGNANRLVIHVPAKSAVSASLVSADLKVSGLQGDVHLRTVSGDISGDVAGNLRANTATGSVRMTARTAKMIEVKTINGDVQLTGGSGEVEVTTVSGDAKIDLGTLTRGRFKSISGNMSTKLSLAPDAELEGESVSGNIRFQFPSAPAADFDIQSISGDIDNCFGPKAAKAHYGPGSRLEFKTGDAQARVRIETKSGDVHMCTGRLSPPPTPAAAPVANCREQKNIFYAI
jgi:Putative adhesin